MMRIAVIGSGIAGLTAAYRLSALHEVTVFEAGASIGGHTATVDVHLDGRDYAIDTGFIVYNDWTYPNFIALLDELGVKSQPTDMGFSVKDPRSGFEYSGSSLGTLFAQRSNLLNPKFWRMLADILRFNRQAIADLDAGRLDLALTLGDYLDANGYGEYFRARYLVPMGAAIWSASTRAMLEFPLLFFVRFFRNHGLLSIDDRPQWRVLTGGSRSYLAPLSAPFRERVFTGTPVRAITRDADGVAITTAQFGTQRFDQVVIATHSDQALAMLRDASPDEREILGAIPYRENDVILHTDASVLPQRRAAWASWNYQLHDDPRHPAVLSYNMNILQGLNDAASAKPPHTFCVTLNRDDHIDPAKILGCFRYAHPEFTVAGIAAQQRWSDINGVNRTWFCGAYWRNGFHEDGVVSGLRVAHALGACAAPLDHARRAEVVS
jgi:predicted NAD/FAD-binding protein